MPHDAFTQSPEELIQIARDAGFRVTRTQLTRWHLADVLPRPVQRPVPGATGSQTRYPEGTDLQLLALCDLRVREPLLARLPWLLWWRGFPVETGVIRRMLETHATAMEQLRAHVAQAGDDSEELVSVVDGFATDRTLPSGLRRMRKRVTAQWFPTVVRILFEQWTGTFRGFESEDEFRAYERAFGAQLRPGRAITGKARSKSEREAVALSADMARLHYSETLQALSDTELVAARDYLRSMATEVQATLLAVRMHGSPAARRAWLPDITELSHEIQLQLFLIHLAGRRARAVGDA